MKQPFSSLALMPQLQNTMTRMVNYYGDADKPLPPMFVTFPGAVQPEPLMENLCDELEQGGYVRFTGVKRWLNMRLDYTEDPKFPSFTRMLESMRRYAGYCNQYHGVVLIDLTQWMTHTSDRHFEDVLVYIHDYSDEVFFFLYVFADDTQRPESMKNAIGRWLYAPCVDVEHLSTAFLHSMLEEKLISSGHILTASAQKLLRQSVETLAAQEDFAGIREIRSLAAAICMDTLPCKRLDVRHLADFSVDGKWFRQRLGQEKITIGFTGGGQPYEKQ